MVKFSRCDRDPSTALLGIKALVPVLIFGGHLSEGLFENPLFQGQLIIDSFFLIEGFWAMELLLHADRHASSWTLLGHRLLKIYPLYLLGLVVSLVLAAALASVGVTQWPASVISQAVVWNTFFLPVFIDPTYVFPLNPPTWAIALEIYIFSALCLARRWIGLRTLTFVAGASAIMCVLVSYQARDVNMGYAPHSYWGGFPRAVFGFICGAIIFHLIRRFGQRLPRLSPPIIWLIYLGMMFLPSRYLSLPLLLFAMPLLVSLAAVGTNPAWLQRTATEAGRLAYGLYMLSYPILIGIEHIKSAVGFVKTPAWIFVLYVIAIATIVLAAYVAAQLIDYFLPSGDLRRSNPAS